MSLFKIGFEGQVFIKGDWHEAKIVSEFNGGWMIVSTDNNGFQEGFAITKNGLCKSGSTLKFRAKPAYRYRNISACGTVGPWKRKHSRQTPDHPIFGTIRAEYDPTTNCYSNLRMI